jgi:hypothetical protein
VRLEPDDLEAIAERVIVLLQDQLQQPPACFVAAGTLGEALGAREEVLATRLGRVSAAGARRCRITGASYRPDVEGRR